MTAAVADSSFVALTRPPRPKLAAATVNVIGVDIGNFGAVAIMTADGALLDVIDWPLLADGPKGRPTVSAPLLADIIAKSNAVHCYAEWIGPRPTDGSVGAWAFGRAKGSVEGILAALGIPVTFLTPQVWKRAIGLPPGRGLKDLSRAEAVRRWPAKASLFARARDDGRADACLICAVGLARERPH